MKAKEILKGLDKKDIKQYVVLYGENNFLIQEGLIIVLKAIDVQMPELNFSIFKEQPNITEVVKAMETLPFMSENRVVLIKDTDILSTTMASEQIKPLEKAMMPKENILIITAQGKLDKRKSFVKFLLKNGTAIECDTFSQNETVLFAKKKAEEKNLTISNADAQYFCELCGNDLYAICSELDKLSSVCVANITKNEIKKYVFVSAQYNIFKIHELLCAKKAVEAKQIIDKLLQDDPNPIGFLTLISNCFRQMLVARACRDAKFSESKTISHVCEETGVSDWVAKRAVLQCKSFTAESLRRGLKKLAQWDFDSKQGGVVLSTDLFALMMDIYRR